MTRKVNYACTGGSSIIETRQFKRFKAENFLQDLEQKNWNCIVSHSDPNKMWDAWRNLMMSAIDKHAPLKKKRVGKKKSPWITCDFLHKMRIRDSLKKKAPLTSDQEVRNQYKRFRNESNIAIKEEKRKYFKENLDANKKDPKTTWKLINDLTSSKQTGHRIAEIKLEDRTINSTPEIAEAFNLHFTNVGPNLASEMLATNIVPEDTK